MSAVGSNAPVAGRTTRPLLIARIGAAQNQDSAIGEQHGVVLVTSEAQRPDGLEGAAGGIVDLSRGQDLERTTLAGVSAHDQHTPVGEQCDRVGFARRLHRARGRERATGRVEDLGRSQKGPACADATDDQHPAVFEQD
ncbi:MAG TPA: hypothetical protein PK954_03700, partial [Anaerolineales bacterium]|nr:hypothetical protein [Anaerolineales bacterium]